MKLLSTIIICFVMLFFCGCSHKNNFTEAEFEATVEKAHKEKDPELILSYLNNTSSIPEIYKANAYVQLGLISEEMHKDQKAILYFKKAIATTNSEVSYQPALIRGVAFYELAKMYLERKEFDKAKVAYEQLLLNHKRYPALKLNSLKVYSELASIGQELKDYKYQYEMLHKVLEFQKKTNNTPPSEIMSAYIFLSDCCNKLGNHKKSVYFGKLAINIYNEKHVENTYLLALAYLHIAPSLYTAGDKEQAIKYAHKAFSILKETSGIDSMYTKNATVLIKKWQPKGE